MLLNLNELKPGEGARKKSRRICRGIGSGRGKTGGKGHKGQKARSGGGVRTGFEGGQMPLYRRLPKFGFTSRVSLTTTDVRTSEINLVDGDIVDLASLQSANIITKNMKRAKIFLSGDVKRAFTIKGLRVTKGAKAAIEAAGGKVEE